MSYPDLSGNERKYVQNAIESSWVSSAGEYVDRFEKEFAALCGTRFALSVVNGTAALHLALLALEISDADEVIVPSLTYVATANAVKYIGATPVFVDVDPNTWCMDPEKVEAAITPRTKAIIAVHLYGHPADMDPIVRIARAHGLKVIEDAAEAPCGTYKGRTTGGLADIATFSFYGNKVFTSGEGGAITTNSEEVTERARLLRGQGMDPKRRYFFPVIGYNYRLTNVACALLCAQLERRDSILTRRNEIFEYYRKRLDAVEGISLQKCADWAQLSPWLFSILVDEKKFGLSRDGVISELAKTGVETRPFFIPIHQLPPYKTQPALLLPYTERLSKSGMNLPTHPMLTTADIDHVASALVALRKS